ncbi:zinc-finger associated domain (zf-AD) domain-containing protein [Phthorimaea operculella]|nr:zinc-finger associated domain (zf-AD) domain-containing protein [Phthorimaea operculella]
MATVSVGRPFGQCRCCLNFGHHKDIMEPFYSEGVEEVYLDAILHCFNLRLSSDEKLPKMICKSCIHRLNYAAEFKAMVIESEQELLKVLNGNIEFVNVAECNNRGVEDENPGYNTRIFKKGDESIKEEIEEEEILEINNIADEEVETNNADESVDKEVYGSVDGDSITDEEDESNNVANDEISILYSAIDKPVKTTSDDIRECTVGVKEEVGTVCSIMMPHSIIEKSLESLLWWKD